MTHVDRREALLTLVSRLAFDDQAPRARLRIAGIRVDFLTRSRPLRARVLDYFAAYLAEEGDAPDVEVYVEQISNPRSIWEDVDPEFDVRADFVVQRDFCARRVEAAETGPRALALVAPDLDDSIQNLLRWLLPPILLKKGAFLLHGAGVVREGRGYVFFGQSGAGKSTSSSLVAANDPESLVLGDDAVIVQMKDEGTPYLHSAPLGCGYSRQAPPPCEVPLAGIYALCQADAHQIAPLVASKGAASLLASAMSVRFDESTEERLELALAFATQTRTGGIGELRFRKDAGFWPKVIQEAEHV